MKTRSAAPSRRGASRCCAWSTTCDRVVGITLEQLRAVRRVVAVAGGERKVAALLGALSGSLVDVLVTDRFTADKLVAAHRSDERGAAVATKRTKTGDL